MVDLSHLEPTLEHRLLRLNTIINIRWLAILGQFSAILVVYLGLGFSLPIFQALLIIIVSAALNLALAKRFPRTDWLNERSATSLLSFDIIQLAALLYLTGGLQNPFAILFLAPVMISATTLPPVRTLGLGALVLLFASALTFFYLPLPWDPPGQLRMPFLYVGGVWLAIMLSIGFISIYAWRVAEEARQIGRALAATELVLAREQHLSQLDGLAAAAAHELGTPLATIALVARELDHQFKNDPDHREDIALLIEQTARCRQILSTIATLGTEQDGPLRAVRIGQLIEEVCAPQRPFGVRITTSFHGSNPEPVSFRSPGVIYGLENLIDNAVDFASTEVTVAAHWTSDFVKIEITDDGRGFHPDVIGKLGDPYITTRSLRSREHNSGGGGLGLGLFIAKTLLERSGAIFEGRNQIAPARGAIVTITWPRSLFELDPVKRRSEEGQLAKKPPRNQSISQLLS
jgi:two-component system, sensor histidine kinase RegB